MQDPPVANDRVTVAGHFIAKAGAIDTVLDLWTELIEHVRAHEPGTELYLLEQDVADPPELGCMRSTRTRQHSSLTVTAR